MSVAAKPLPRVRKSRGASTPGVSVAEVRVTVTATNGFDSAIINEVRLYGHDGTGFPARPKQADS